ncbi:MAG: hypothetical protein WBC85_10310 [Planktotalea sp.]
MFRLLKLIFVLAIGAMFGFFFSGMLMRAECTASGGQIDGMICVSAEMMQ